MRTMEQGSSHLDNFPLNVFSVTPYTPSTADIQVSDDDKAGATLLFSGIFLGLVGITFTIMGWIKYQGVSHFEWTQLLGPILLSVGVTFMLIAVCKFKMLSCQVCKESEERALDSEQTAGGQSFVFTGINQPITFHGATVVQYIPPPYGSQEPLGINAAYLQPVVNPCGLIPPGGVVTATPSPPQYYTIYPPDNATFIGEQDYSSIVAGGNDRYVVWRGDGPLVGVTVTACGFVQSRRKLSENAKVCVASSQGGGVGSETHIVGCNGSVLSAPTARSGPDADQLEETQLGEEDSTCFSPPPYEEIYSLPR